MTNFAFEDISLPRSWRCCDLLVLFIKFPNKQELHRARFNVNPWNNLTVNVQTDGQHAVEALLDALRAVIQGSLCSLQYARASSHDSVRDCKKMTVVQGSFQSLSAQSSQHSFRGKQRKYVVGLVGGLITAYAVHFIHLRIRAVRRCV